MSEFGWRADDGREIVRLRDELEQARTALESTQEEVSRLAEDRNRLLARLTEQARELQAANTAYARATAETKVAVDPDLARARESETDEELRVAFEELQVLTEELEVANNSLRKTNQVLDRRVGERTQELEARNIALAQSELRFRTLVEGMPQLVWRSAPGGEYTWCSPQWAGYTGLSPAESHGLGWLRALHPDDRAAARAAWARAGGDRPLEYEARLFHVGEGRYCHHRTRAVPARTEAGEVVEWLGTSTDVDDLITLQGEQAVLVAELQHRTRNLMGVVRSVISRTLEGSRTLAEFRATVIQRLDALARAQSLLSRRGEGRRVAFDALLREEIEAHVALDGAGRGEQVAISGPPRVWLYSSTVQALALGLHELMTNAVKYGALSTPGGRLDVTWSVAETPAGRRHLRIDWRESGVSDMPDPVAAPRGGGYERELIERALPYQLGAETTFAFGDDGVRCSIEVGVAEA